MLIRLAKRGQNGGRTGGGKAATEKIVNYFVCTFYNYTTDFHIYQFLKAALNISHSSQNSISSIKLDFFHYSELLEGNILQLSFT